MDHSENQGFEPVLARSPIARAHPGPAPSPPGLRLSVTRRRDAVVLTAAGEIDLATTSAFSEALVDAIGRRPPLLVVDLTSIRFLACSGLSVLVAARHLAGERTRLAVVAGSRTTWRSTHLTGVDQLLIVHRTLDDALPQRPLAPRLVLRTVVADGSILLTATGGSRSGDAEAVTDALRQACDLCRGVVLFDVSACTLPIADLVGSLHAVISRGGRVRCGVRVLTADERLIRALDFAGIAHGVAAEPS
ncbi:STAS domain-containing protein [Amycolatopsis sp. A133]|uniref:STAS domain-containing protein n=1 Tax=Amycolatopsis sp. A133 TaxID=3064472 RepID=UPI0027F3F01F|nr:STAS domain-containing protein [Amycolatopsis sp. A133]MDQ7810728.1 STAS domain-containing protein [Amycolatopsis sp. A133]